MNRVNWKSVVVLGLMLLTASTGSSAEVQVFELRIQNHLFMPDVLEIPAGVQVRLVIYNDDPTPEEFESRELNREKVVMGNSKVSLLIGPLVAGTYAFFGEFNPLLAQGSIVVH